MNKDYSKLLELKSIIQNKIFSGLDEVDNYVKETERLMKIEKPERENIFRLKQYITPFTFETMLIVKILMILFIIFIFPKEAILSKYNEIFSPIIGFDFEYTILLSFWIGVPIIFPFLNAKETVFRSRYENVKDIGGSLVVVGIIINTIFLFLFDYNFTHLFMIYLITLVPNILFLPLSLFISVRKLKKYRVEKQEDKDLIEAKYIQDNNNYSQRLRIGQNRIMEIQKSVNEIEINISIAFQECKDLDILHEDFWVIRVIDQLIVYFEHKRADSIKEAVELYIKEKREKKIDMAQEEHSQQMRNLQLKNLEATHQQNKRLINMEYNLKESISSVKSEVSRVGSDVRSVGSDVRSVGSDVRSVGSDVRKSNND